MEWLKDHIVELVALVVALVGVGGVLSLLGEVAQMILTYPYALIFTAILCGMIGFFAAYMLGIRDYRIKKLEYRRMDSDRKNREEEEDERELDNSLKMFKEDPCAMKKAMAAEIYKQPGHRSSVDIIGKSQIERMESNFGAVNAWHPFFTFDARGGNFWYVELQEWLIWMFDAYPDLVGDFAAELINQCEEMLKECAP